MKSLNTAQQKQLASIVSVLTDTRAKLEAGYASYQKLKKACSFISEMVGPSNTVHSTQLETLLESLSESANKYSAAVDSAGEFCQGIAAAIKEYIDSKSEAWQKSSRGEDYQTWKEEWGAIAEELKKVPRSPDLVGGLRGYGLDRTSSMKIAVTLSKKDWQHILDTLYADWKFTLEDPSADGSYLALIVERVEVATGLKVSGDLL